MKSSQISAAELEARVARFGLRVTASLSERSGTLPHGVSERLRFAREQALARAAQARAAAGAVAVAQPRLAGVGTLVVAGGPRPAGKPGTDLWAMLLSALPLLLLAAGLLLMQHGQFNEQIAAAAEVDATLLSDTLPPAAYADPGFAEYLRDTEE